MACQGVLVVCRGATELPFVIPPSNTRRFRGSPEATPANGKVTKVNQKLFRSRRVSTEWVFGGSIDFERPYGVLAPISPPGKARGQETRRKVAYKGANIRQSAMNTGPCGPLTPPSAPSRRPEVQKIKKSTQAGQRNPTKASTKLYRGGGVGPSCKGPSMILYI